jgi:diacylglycerol kinase family enzyme
VGGDGTISEAINGMLARLDGQRLPIGLVPNGSSNDLCRSLGIKSVDYALDFILKRETLSIDAIRVLIDVDSEQGLPNGPERLKNCRYMMSGSQMSMPAKIAKTAKNLGFCSCSKPLVSFYKGVTRSFEEDKYGITIDGTKIESDVSTGMLVVNNGKYSGNGAIFNPFGVVNDGLIDIAWVNDPSYNGYWALSGLMKKALSQEGIQAYDGNCLYLRGQSITIRYGGKA